MGSSERGTQVCSIPFQGIPCEARTVHAQEHTSFSGTDLVLHSYFLNRNQHLIMIPPTGLHHVPKGRASGISQGIFWGSQVPDTGLAKPVFSALAAH